MRFITTLALALALTFAPAMAFAASTPRAVTPGLVMGKGDTQTVFEIFQSEITTSGHCLAVNAGAGTLDSGACDNYALNYYVVPRPFKVSNLRVVVGLPGDTGYICVFTIEVATVATGNTLTTTATAAAGTVFNQAQNFVVNEGDKIGIMVADGGAACVGTADPSFNVQLEGEFL